MGSIVTTAMALLLLDLSTPALVILMRRPPSSDLLAETTRLITPTAETIAPDDVALLGAHQWFAARAVERAAARSQGLSVTGRPRLAQKESHRVFILRYGNINGRGILAQTARLGGLKMRDGDGI